MEVFVIYSSESEVLFVMIMIFVCLLLPFQKLTDFFYVSPPDLLLPSALLPSFSLSH